MEDNARGTPTTLYVDESGQFGEFDDRRPDASVVVAAWGVGDDIGPSVDRAVRTASAARWPFLQWPLHRAHLFEPCWLVLCHGAWALDRDLDLLPDALTRTGQAPPSTAQEFRSLADSIRPHVDEFGLGEEWHALHAWGARRGFRLSGPGSGRLTFCWHSDAALRRARGSKDKVDEERVPELLERTLERLHAGLGVSIDAARKLKPALFPLGIPKGLRQPLAELQRETLGLFEAARREADRVGARAPLVLAAAEREAHAAAGAPDRYFALLGGLVGRAAQDRSLAPTSLVVEGRRYAPAGAEGKGQVRLAERDLVQLTGAHRDHRWGRLSVEDKRRSWAGPEVDSRTASHRNSGHGSGLIGSRPGSPRHVSMKEDLQRLTEWPVGLVLADFAAFELRHRLRLDRDALLAFVEGELETRFQTDGRLHLEAVPESSPDADRPWARRLP